MPDQLTDELGWLAHIKDHSLEELTKIYGFAKSINREWSLQFAILDEMERREKEHATVVAELDTIKRTMSLCGIGDYKTWKECQDQAYDVVRNQADRIDLLERYQQYLWECAHDGALTFEEWEKEYGGNHE